MYIHILYSSILELTLSADNDSADLDIDVDIVMTAADAFHRTMLLLPFTELVDEGFPIPSHEHSRTNFGMHAASRYCPLPSCVLCSATLSNTRASPTYFYALG